jgi:hypothetical protein
MHLPPRLAPKTTYNGGWTRRSFGTFGLVAGILDRMNMVRLGDLRQSGQLAIRP